MTDERPARAACRITLLGSHSGKNLGDAAILSSAMEAIAQELPNAEFYVPTTNPRFVRESYRGSYRMRVLSVLPWTGSIRLLGLPTLWAIARSDAALICDGIIFGKKILNPLFNFLITLVFLAPWCKLTGCKLVCYCCGIGPFPSRFSRWCAKFLLERCDIITFRDPESEAMARSFGITTPIERTGDIAYLNSVSDDARALEICRAERIPVDQPLLGINVTGYFDAWLRSEERVDDRDAFLRRLAGAIRAARTKAAEPFHPLIVSTHPMDEAVVTRLADMVGGSTLTNSRYLSHDIQAVMRRCGLFVGMRFHSLVLSSSVGVPVFGLVYAPKVRGLMREIDPDSVLELAELTEAGFATKLADSWNRRAELLERQRPVVERFRQGARDTTISLCRRVTGAARGVDLAEARSSAEAA
jgi:polysaccharide pyruvyl transferase WcaK-like protein